MARKSFEGMSDVEIRQYMIERDKRNKKIIFMIVLAVITISPAVARYKEILTLIMGK